MKSIFIIFILSFALLSCSSEDTKPPSGISTFTAQDADPAEALQELRAIQQSVVYGHKLRKSTPESKSLITAAIENGISGALLAQKAQSHFNLEQLETAASILDLAIRQYDDAGVLEFEEADFSRAFNKLRLLRGEIYKKMGREDNYTWLLYDHNFAGGIEPEFSAPAGKSSFKDGQNKWSTNFQTGEPKAKIGVSEGFAWLISKPFDLSQVQNPSFRFLSIYQVIDKQPDLTLYDVLKNTFKTYIILDLKAGERIEDVEDSRKILVEYSKDEVPLGRNFSREWLPKVSLEKYKKDHSISIGFLFDTTKAGRKYYEWYIYDFQIHGSGMLRNPPSLYYAEFAKDLAGFRSLSPYLVSSKWAFDSKTDGVKVRNFQEKTEAVLLSPLFVVTKEVENLSLKISESFKNLEDFSNAEVLVSDSYTLGQEPNFNDKEMWKNLRSGGEELKTADLSEYAGKNLVFAFRFKSSVKKETWQLKSFYLENAGGEVTAIPYPAPKIDNSITVAAFDFLEDNYRLFKKEYDQRKEAPEWKKGSKDLSISGFVNGGDNLLGWSRITLPTIDLKSYSTLKLRLFHKIGYFKDLGPLSVQIREICPERSTEGSTEKTTKETPEDSSQKTEATDATTSTEEALEEAEPACKSIWEEIVFPEGTYKDFGKGGKKEWSPWGTIKEKFYNKKVEISLRYEAEARNTPAWYLNKLEVQGEE